MASDTKVALITGANKGIGLEIARQLGHQGITVVLGSRDPQRGQEAVDTLKAEGIDAQTLKLEVTDAADRDAALTFFQQRGRPDILINNAGILLDAEGATPDTLTRSFDANATAPYLLAETLLPLLKAAPAGRGCISPAFSARSPPRRQASSRRTTCCRSMRRRKPR